MSDFTRMRYLNFTRTASWILFLLFIIMEVITSFLHYKAKDFPIHFVVYYSFAGLIIVGLLDSLLAPIRFTHVTRQKKISLRRFLFIFFLEIIFGNI